MRWILAAAAGALATLATCAGANARPILYDAVALNIGVNCQWQSRCMGNQRAAMKRSLNYVAKSHPPHWRVELCNRNAARGGYRVDWIGFDHCIRNASLLRPPPARASKRRTKR
jgi:hypothetical protein